eukprot:SAG11_NODE_21672_length_420_cov_2.286604_1_plen_62_part_10
MTGINLCKILVDFRTGEFFHALARFGLTPNVVKGFTANSLGRLPLSYPLESQYLEVFRIWVL